MTKTAQKNLEEAVRRLGEDLGIARTYGDLTKAEREESLKLTDALERFEETVLYPEG